MSDVPDIEVGRYALRSFKFQSALIGVCPYPTNERRTVERLGWWEHHGRAYVKFWSSPSYAVAGDWEDGTCTASCQERRNHVAPASGCRCGIYASLSYADLIYHFSEISSSMVAVIAAEGATIIGDRGLRTAYARVVAYWMDTDAVRRRVAALQFRDAKRFESVVEMVDTYRIAWLPPLRASRPAMEGRPAWWTASAP